MAFIRLNVPLRMSPVSLNASFYMMCVERNKHVKRAPYYESKAKANHLGQLHSRVPYFIPDSDGDLKEMFSST